MGARRDAPGDLGEMQVHHLCVAGGQDQSCRFPILGADSAENIGRGGALILGSAWTRAAFGPTARNLVLLADARLIGEPDFYFGAI